MGDLRTFEPDAGRLFDPGSLGAILADSKVIAFAAIRDGRVIFANPAFGALFGRRQTLAGIALRHLFAPYDRARLADALTVTERSSEIFAGRAVREDGSSFEIELRLAFESIDGQPTVVVFAGDITQRNRSETQLSCLAYSDWLTGLPNRAFLADCLGQTMRTARREDHSFAVLVADLDGFKAVNDTWGHAMGDTVLKLVAQRFLSCMRKSDTLARLGGDEFGVLVTRLRSAEDAERIAGRLVRVAQRPIEVGGHDVRVGTSVGISMFPDHATSVDTLIAAADSALYRAKRERRSCYRLAAPLCESETTSLPLICWSEAHEVGIKEIDEQHVQLASQINEFADALKNGHLRNDTAGKLAGIVRLAEFHFATEERLMAAYGFEDSVLHRATHSRLLDDIRTLAAERDFRSVSLTTRYLQEWLLRHIDGMDKQLGRALRRRGVR